MPRLDSGAAADGDVRGPDRSGSGTPAPEFGIVVEGRNGCRRGSCRDALSVSGNGLASTRTNRRNPGGRYGRYTTLIDRESIPGWASRMLAFARELAEYGPTQREPCQPKLVFPWPPPVY